MKAMIEGYRNFPGRHCGSSAMRSLLHHYCDLLLPEETVFGLGAGVGCALVTLPDLQPSTVIFGRTATMEIDLANSLGLDYAEAPEPDDERAWRDVRDEVIAGRPTLLTGDIFYLDYREYKVHFPAHRFVLLGFDDDQRIAWIADRLREEPEACSYDALFASRNPTEGLSTRNLWGRFGSGAVRRDLVEATRIALATAARRMLGVESAASDADEESNARPNATTLGIAAIRRLAEEVPAWASRPDAFQLASYNASCIEKFGNGGGNFRRLYASFLEDARSRDPDRVPSEAPGLARRAADGWTALAHRLWATEDDPSAWDEAAGGIRRLADTEQELFESLANAAERAV